MFSIICTSDYRFASAEEDAALLDEDEGTTAAADDGGEDPAEEETAQSLEAGKDEDHELLEGECGSGDEVLENGDETEGVCQCAQQKRYLCE